VAAHMGQEWRDRPTRLIAERLRAFGSNRRRAWPTVDTAGDKRATVLLRDG
jgi:hypothetical protein